MAENWTKVLSKDENTGGIDVVFDPRIRTLFRSPGGRAGGMVFSSGGPEADCIDLKTTALPETPEERTSAILDESALACRAETRTVCMQLSKRTRDPSIGMTPDNWTALTTRPIRQRAFQDFCGRNRRTRFMY
jgi:hypothetical protein